LEISHTLWTQLFKKYQSDVQFELILQMGANLHVADKEDLTPLDLAMKSRPPIVEYTKSGPCEAYMWGTNANFNLGIGNQQSKTCPELVEHFRRNNIGIKQVFILSKTFT